MIDDARRNRKAWDRLSNDFAVSGRRNWQQNASAHWGIWHVEERELQVLGDVSGKDVLEHGCGNAYFSSWLARRGARVVGLDNSPGQLAHARAFQREFGVEFPLVLADGAQVPLANESFDIVFNEYGAALWVEPERMVAEAVRLLRPGGLLAFLTNSAIIQLCWPMEAESAGTSLVCDYFGMHRSHNPADGSVEFHLPHGEWIRLLRRYGFVVEDLIEIRPPEGATSGWKFVSLEWARRWPCEEIWKARKL
ncbi:MAG: class I SAM-dependent methyltransferase [Deltaproteobacteria bacterium]|nr:class I SAM-dependent methyltransferase [Deltaproteobacteria bacterium]MBI3386172.1 class I SAM-dependent methyltransferase [Deltaproteobacteria bacterium]